MGDLPDEIKVHLMMAIIVVVVFKMQLRPLNGYAVANLVLLVRSIFSIIDVLVHLQV